MSLQHLQTALAMGTAATAISFGGRNSTAHNVGIVYTQSPTDIPCDAFVARYDRSGDPLYGTGSLLSSARLDTGVCRFRDHISTFDGQPLIGYTRATKTDHERIPHFINLIDGSRDAPEGRVDPAFENTILVSLDAQRHGLQRVVMPLLDADFVHPHEADTTATSIFSALHQYWTEEPSYGPRDFVIAVQDESAFRAFRQALLSAFPEGDDACSDAGRTETPFTEMSDDMRYIGAKLLTGMFHDLLFEYQRFLCRRSPKITVGPRRREIFESEDELQFPQHELNSLLDGAALASSGFYKPHFAEGTWRRINSLFYDALEQVAFNRDARMSSNFGGYHLLGDTVHLCPLATMLYFTSGGSADPLDYKNGLIHELAHYELGLALPYMNLRRQMEMAAPFVRDKFVNTSDEENASIMSALIAVKRSLEDSNIRLVDEALAHNLVRYENSFRTYELSKLDDRTLARRAFKLHRHFGVEISQHGLPAVLQEALRMMNLAYINDVSILELYGF